MVKEEVEIVEAEALELRPQRNLGMVKEEVEIVEVETLELADILELSHWER